jgi:hypothetical protein
MMRLRYKAHIVRLAGLLLVATVIVGAGYPESRRFGAPASPMPVTLFGMHIHRIASTTPWPGIPFGSWRLWDAQVGWPQLESEKGRWNFSTLDKYVEAAEQHGVDILLPLGPTPGWASSRPTEPSAYRAGNAAPPANMDDWREYVRTVANRYKGRIHKYEIWNEPNLKDFYSGSMVQMLDLVRIAHATLKAVDPSVILCSPSATGTQGIRWLDLYLQLGGGKYADAIGYHFYVTPEPPERMVPLIQQVKALMEKHGAGRKPLWNTETGWAIENHQSIVQLSAGTSFNKIVLPTEQASAYLARAYLLSWAAGVSRLYWYAWDNSAMGLTEEDGKTIKAPGRVYEEVQEWLVGARMTSCQSDNAGTWMCQITRGNGYQGWIVWNPDRSVQFSILRNWRVRHVRELSGLVRDLKDQEILINSTPVLLETSAQ